MVSNLIENLNSQKNVSQSLSEKEIVFYSKIEASMKTEFKNKNQFFTKFVDYLNECISQWLKGVIYSPVATICQSSGHGKTR